MDLSYQNILKTENRLWIIDYEYADLAYHGLDLANYINERLYEYNYKLFEFFPEDEMSPSTQREFVEIYSVDMGLQFEDLWNEVQKCRAIVNYVGALWAGCMFKPTNYDFLDYSELRFSQFRHFSNLI